MSKKLKLTKLRFRLWEESCKAKALGEMLMFQDREQALDEGDIWAGYGMLIRNIGEKLSRLSKRVDQESVRRATSVKSDKKTD